MVFRLFSISVQLLLEYPRSPPDYIRYQENLPTYTSGGASAFLDQRAVAELQSKLPGYSDIEIFRLIQTVRLSAELPVHWFGNPYHLH